MPKKIDIIVKEQLEFLEKSFAKELGSLKKDRIKTLIFVKTGKFFYQSDIAKKLGRNEKTIRDWLQCYNENGFSDFLEVRSGGNNTKTISEKMIQAIDKKVSDPNSTITSYVELKLILENELKVEIHYGALYSHCRRNLKSKLKVARKSHYKKDDKAEEVFKKP